MYLKQIWKNLFFNIKLLVEKVYLFNIDKKQVFLLLKKQNEIKDKILNFSKKIINKLWIFHTCGLGRTISFFGGKNMIKKSKYSIEEREKILFMFKKGYTAKEIGKSIGRSKEAIQKEIQKLKKGLKNLDELKKQAEEVRRNRKCAIRAINSEVNSYISSRALISKTRQHYKTSKNGDLILKNNNCEYTSDMPKKFINEEGRKWRNAIKYRKKI